MFALLRRIARPLGVFVMLAMAVPALALDCRELSAMSGDAMPCCKPSGPGTELNTGCCGVTGEQAGPTQPPTTAAAARSASDAVLATAALLPFDSPAPHPGFSTSSPVDTGPPSDRLYIRFSVIRR
jgi:hypothetical protein